MEKIIVKNPSGTSKAWDHFGFYKVGGKILKEKAVCKICQQECKYTGGTTNLNTHLQKHHSELFQTSGGAEAPKKSIQTQITSMMKKPVVKLPANSKSRQMYTEVIGEFLCGDLVPLSIVESKYFKAMVSMLSGGTYDTPSRRYYTDTLLPKMLNECTLQLRREITELTGIGLTTDSWTSSATENYIAYTAHYITKDWELRSKVLSTSCSEEPHTSKNLAQDMTNTEEKWGMDKLLFGPVYVHDNAANVTKAPKIMENPRLGLGCLAHTINLAANSATGVQQVANIITKGRKLVTVFNKSTLALNVLKKKQALLLPDKQHKLKQDCPTRWNSTYDMLARLNEQSQAVSAAVMDPTLKHLNLREYIFSAEEEGIMEEVLTVLKPMKIATILVSGEKQPTASKILPILAKLRKEMTVNDTLDSELTKEMKQNVITNLNKRYTDQSVSGFLLKTSFLDPRYKSLHNIAKEGAIFVTKHAIREMCVKVVEKRQASVESTSSSDLASFPSLSASAAVKEEAPVEIPEPSSSSTLQCNEPPKKKIKIEEEYDDWLSDVICVGTEKISQSNDLELIDKELEKYDAEQQITGDPLAWWKSREGSMPILSEVAKSVLCVPGSSVPSERVFSKAGQILNKRRASLKSKNVNMLISLNKNYSFKFS